MFRRTVPILIVVFRHCLHVLRAILYKFTYFTSNWLLSTNHRRISIMYFVFVLITSFTGLILATIIRIELAYPGKIFLANNSEKYLTLISLHGIVMVFFVVIPVIFGAFGNFLLPTQLGVRDVAFPRLNSFMFWVTPSGFVLLLHIVFFDKNIKLVDDIELYDQLNGAEQILYIFGRTPHRFDHPIMSELKWYYGYFQYLYVDSSNTDSVWMFENKIYTWEWHMWMKNFAAQISEDVISHLEVCWLALLSNDVGQKNKFWGAYEYYRFIHAELSKYSLFTQHKELVQSWWNANKDEKKYKPIAFVIKTSSWAYNQLIPGWAFITPYTSRLKYASIGKVDIALVVVFAAGLGSIFSAVNYLITYRCVCTTSMKNRREVRSFFVDSLLVGSRMMLAANPALLIAILFLLSDRQLNTSIFDFSGGGDAVLFQHLFWFFGHPEVYIVIIPCFGFVNSLLPYFLRKRLSGRLSLQFSMYTIAFMGFAVWGHHMYMVGLANTTRTLYSTMTVMISVPASTKVLHWCVTLVNSSPVLDVSFCFLIAFAYFFTLGGLSGMFVAHMGFDVLFHDTFYVIGHFHVMFAGAATSCIFAAFYFYFSSLTGVRYSKFFAYLHFIFYFFGQLLTVIPMFWLGYSGMPRRIMDYPSYFGGWHSVVSAGHLLSVIGYIFFIIMIIDSLYEGVSIKNRLYGVSRLNTRFSFYVYMKSKLAYNKTALSLRVAEETLPEETILTEYLIDIN